MPLTALALGAGGALAGRLIAGRRPEFPDINTNFEDPLRAQMQVRREQTNREMRRRTDDVERSAAARGQGGSATMAPMRQIQDANTRLVRNQVAQEQSALADARNRERQLRNRMALMRFEDDRATHAARTQGVADLFGGMAMQHTVGQMTGDDRGFGQRIGDQLRSIGGAFGIGGDTPEAIPAPSGRVQAPQIGSPFSGAGSLNVGQPQVGQPRQTDFMDFHNLDFNNPF